MAQTIPIAVGITAFHRLYVAKAMQNHSGVVKRKSSFASTMALQNLISIAKIPVIISLLK